MRILELNCVYFALVQCTVLWRHLAHTIYFSVEDALPAELGRNKNWPLMQWASATNLFKCTYKWSFVGGNTSALYSTLEICNPIVHNLSSTSGSGGSVISATFRELMRTHEQIEWSMEKLSLSLSRVNTFVFSFFIDLLRHVSPFQLSWLLNASSNRLDMQWCNANDQSRFREERSACLFVAWSWWIGHPINFLAWCTHS